jgi:hemoglobin
VVNQLGEATGGPQVYEGASMKTAHATLGITVADFNAFVEDLVTTLDAAAVPAAEQQQLLALLSPMQSDIVTA